MQAARNAPHPEAIDFARPGDHDAASLPPARARPDTMTTLHRIALLGFSAFERNTLGSYFRLASTREPRYEQVASPAEADFVVADADHAASVQQVQATERMPEAVFVGGRPPEGAIAWLARPIDPLRVLRELDAMAARRMPRAPRPPRHEAAAGSAQTNTTDAARRRTVIQPVRPHRPALPPELAEAAADTLDLMLPDLAAPARDSAAAPPSTALLVDDSDIALRFLEKKLAPFGLVTDCVTHSAAALERLASRHYDFVFLDMELGEHSALDGLGLCQHIKREPAPANVVLVTAHHTELDRVRGALAGCDGFLGKPLDDDELALYLARFGVTAAANAGRAPS